MSVPVFEAEGVTLHHGDCMEFLRSQADRAFDIAICDPPYGIGDALVRGGTWSVRYQKKGAAWDVKPDGLYFQEVRRVAKNWIVWGANYFTDQLPPSRGFVAWHKPHMDGMHTMSNCELAFTSFDTNAKCVSIARPTEDRVHVCQKPVALYSFLLERFAKPGDKILDTHVGSGSSAVACLKFGVRFTGCEIDADYHAAAVDRIKKELSQGRLFSPAQIQQTQTEFPQ